MGSHDCISDDAELVAVITIPFFLVLDQFYDLRSLFTCQGCIMGGQDFSHLGLVHTLLFEDLDWSIFHI
jgi:hypothetical protein